MSCPFKPGDRVEKIAMHANPAGGIRLDIGAVGTVTSMPISDWNKIEGADMSVRIDSGDERNTFSNLWRRIDGPTDQSALEFVQSLSQPQTERA